MCPYYQIVLIFQVHLYRENFHGFCSELVSAKIAVFCDESFIVYGILMITASHDNRFHCKPMKVRSVKSFIVYMVLYISYL